MSSNITEADSFYDETMDKFLAVIYFVMAATVLTLNGLEIYLIYRLRKERSVTNVFIVSLTVTDILMGSLGIPFSAIAITYKRDWKFGNVMCNITGFFVNTAIFTSLISICLITINRYLALVLPLSYKRLATYNRALIAVFLCWFFGFFRSSIPFFMSHAYEYYKSTLCGWSTSTIFGEDNELPWFIIILVLPFVLTFCTIVYCLTHMAVVLIRRSEIKKAKNNGNPGSGKHGNNDKEREAVITTLCIISAFVLSYFCYYFSLFVYLLNKFENWNDTQYLYLEVFMILTIYMNSLFNPILYILRNTKFKNELIHLKTSFGLTYRNTFNKRAPVDQSAASTSHGWASKVDGNTDQITPAILPEGHVVSNASVVKETHQSPNPKNGV